MTKISTALENHLEFPFLASDTHPVHGLQDWSTTQWATQIQQHPELSMLLAQMLLDNGSTGEDPCELALQIKQALRQAQPLSRWRTVVAYQNSCLNDERWLDDLEGEGCSSTFYMSSELLSNAVFRRDFPLGVDRAIAQYRWRFAVQNSGSLTLALATPAPHPHRRPSPSPSPSP